jgi:hypothetical protein
MTQLAQFHLTFPGPISQSLSFRVALAWPRLNTHTHSCRHMQCSGHNEAENEAIQRAQIRLRDLETSAGRRSTEKRWRSSATPASLLKFGAEASRAQRRVLGTAVLNSSRFPQHFKAYRLALFTIIFLAPLTFLVFLFLFTVTVIASPDKTVRKLQKCK